MKKNQFKKLVKAIAKLSVANRLTGIWDNRRYQECKKEFKQTNKGSLINFNEADSRIEFQNKFGRLQEVVNGVKRKKAKTREEDAEINQLKKELGIGG